MLRSLVGSEMCIRDSADSLQVESTLQGRASAHSTIRALTVHTECGDINLTVGSYVQLQDGSQCRIGALKPSTVLIQRLVDATELQELLGERGVRLDVRAAYCGKQAWWTNVDEWVGVDCIVSKSNPPPLLHENVGPLGPIQTDQLVITGACVFNRGVLVEVLSLIHI
eukprot:TRINITY_DN46961_c0_g1_i1.p1 TRINITY_DN46961_c0_g1~~TRINITY_DN46961_c0_g1_i1.p1  ORF type:complete len:168 (-),score=22.17 TRINITY_DN46961_c0_g1_i1:196-699(-)